MQVENIRFFLSLNYSDEKLAALLAHAESGKLTWYSCCCLVGIPTAPHPLKGRCPVLQFHPHIAEARRLPFGRAADGEFLHLGNNDAERRERIWPLIKEEMARREQAREQSVEEAGVTV